MKNSFVILLCTMIGTLLSAQIYRQSNASNYIKEASLVRFADENPFPQFIQLENSTLKADEIPSWLFANLNLPQGTSFKLLKKTSDKIGQTHYRFQQYFNDIPIEAGIYIAHCQNNQVLSLNGELFDLSTTASSPLLLEGDAVVAALSHVRAETYGWELNKTNQFFANIEFPNPELVFIPKDLDFKNPSFHLAYKMDIYAAKPHGRSWVYVDARTAQIIAEENRICTDEGTAETVYSGTQTIETEFFNGSYRLHDLTRGGGIQTYNAYGTDIFSSLDTLDYFFDDDNFWDNGGLEQYATDVHWGTEVVYDYFFDEHNLNSYDGEGHIIRSYANFGSNFGNAFWDGRHLVYGSGDPSPEGGINLPAGALEVCGHEFTHAVTDYSANLIYSSESGALNESFSDIFGVVIDFVTRPDEANWSISNEVTFDGLGIRNMQNPNAHEHPDTYLGEYWSPLPEAVHTNSGVQNYWFYLLAEGGFDINDNEDNFMVEGIGLEKAANIAYRNLSVYLTPSSNYLDAAFLSTIVAVDLYGECGHEWQQVQNAWAAVGLSSASTEFTADFSVDDNKFCEFPVTVQFANHSAQIENAIWDFGDGDTSTEMSPTHEYEEEGIYDVSLIAISCAGEIDTLLQESLIIIDDELSFCDTIVMSTEGSIITTECFGVITDDNQGPGGAYSTGVNSIISIQAGSPVTLHFIEFFISENFDDDIFYLYDGADTTAPLIGAFDGNDIEGESITSTANSICIHFISDYIPFSPDGFVIEFSTGSSVPPVAGFTIPSGPLLFNIPVTFTPISDANEWFWDFGDEETSTESQPTHLYEEAGTYQVTQIISNCISTDTIVQEVTISEPPLGIVHTPDSICITLYTGETYTENVVLSVQNGGNMYYDVKQNYIIRDTMTRDYYNGTGTIHNFDIDVLLDSLKIKVIVEGDFYEDDQFAEVYVEGNLLGEVGHNNTSPDYAGFSIHGNLLSEILGNGNAVFGVYNSEEAEILFLGTNRHTVTIEGYKDTWLAIPENTGTASINTNADIPIVFDASGLESGVYTDSIHIHLNDTIVENISIPVKMTVIGRPVPVFVPNPLGFDATLIGNTSIETLTIYNEGVDTFEIYSVNSSNADFTQPITSASIAPFDSLSIPIEFSPQSAGFLSATLDFVTNTGDTSIIINGIRVAPPISDINPDSICLTLETGETTTQQVYITNTGGSDLYYCVETQAFDTPNAIYFEDFNDGIYNDTILTTSPLSNFSTEILTASGSNNDIFSISGNGRIYVDINSNENLSSISFDFQIINLPNRLRILLLQDEDFSNSVVEIDIESNPDLLEFNSHPEIEDFIIEDIYEKHRLTANNIDFNTRTFDLWLDTTLVAEALSINDNVSYISRLYIASTTVEDQYTLDNIYFGENDIIEIDWLTIEINCDTLALGETDTIDVNISANGLPEGTYESNIVFETNEPNTSQQYIPVKMNVVVGEALIETPDALDFGTIYSQFTKTDTLCINNPGTDTLYITNISTNTSDFIINNEYTNLIIAPVTNAKIPIVFSPQGQLGNFNGIITIENNVQEAIVVLIGQSIAPPFIDIVPDSICTTLLINTDTTQQLIINNIGGSELIYCIEDLVWEDPIILQEDFEDGIYEDNLTFFDTLTSPFIAMIIPENTENDHLQVSGGGILGSNFSTLNNFSLSLDFQIISAGSYFYVRLNDGEQQVISVDIDPYFQLLSFSYAGAEKIYSITDLYAKHHLDIANIDFNTSTFDLYFDGETIGENLSFEGEIFSGINALTIGTYGTQSLYTIDNVLIYDHSVPSTNWLTIAPLCDTILAEDSDTIDMHIDATGLLAETYEHNISIMTNDSANTFITVPAKLIVIATPLSDFSVSTTYSCNGTVDFIDESSNIPTSWFWNFGDDNTSQEQSPSHTYAENGIHNVRLIACNDAGCDTLVQTNYIEVSIDGQFCDTIVFPIDTIIQVTSCGGILSGDNFYNPNGVITIHSDNGNPIILEFGLFLLWYSHSLYIYDGSSVNASLIGTYTGVDLMNSTIYSSGDALSIRLSSSIDFFMPYNFEASWRCTEELILPEVSFETIVDCDDLSVLYTANASFTDSLVWNMGDGTIATFPENHNYIYEVPGNYTVTLTAFNENGESSYTQLINVPETAFTITAHHPDTVFVDETVGFSIDTSLNTSSVNWFINGLNYEEENVSLIFDEPGVYPVITTVVSSVEACVDTIYSEIVVLLSVGTQILEKLSRLNIYPNPTTGLFMIDYSFDGNQDIGIEVFNSTGQLIYTEDSGKSTTFKKEIDLTNHPVGLYWIMIRLEDKLLTKKIIVQ